MLLLRCLGYLFVGMAGAVLFLGREPGETARHAGKVVPDLVSRAEAALASDPLTASSVAEEPTAEPAALLPSAIEEAVAELSGTTDLSRTLVPGQPVTFYPAPRPLDSYMRRDAPADIRPPAPASGAEVATDGLVYVSGSRVNLRAGPGTDRHVVAALTRGMEAEPIGPSEGGWQRIRVVATGDEGWMADRFLATRRP